MSSDTESDRPDNASRVPEPVRGADLAALDDLAFHEQFHQRYPLGSIIEDTADLTALVKGAVENAHRADTAEAHIEALKAAIGTRDAALRDAVRLAGEVQIRRFLDDLAEVGLPSTLYQTFRPEYRDYITRRLTFVVSRANALLGQLHNLPASAIAERDKRYAERDAADGDDLAFVGDDEARRLFDSAFNIEEDDDDEEVQ